MCHMGLVYVGHVQSVEMGEKYRMWSGVCATWDWFMQDMFSLWRWERSGHCAVLSLKTVTCAAFVRQWLVLLCPAAGYCPHLSLFSDTVSVLISNCFSEWPLIYSWKWSVYTAFTKCLFWRQVCRFIASKTQKTRNSWESNWYPVVEDRQPCLMLLRICSISGGCRLYRMDWQSVRKTVAESFSSWWQYFKITNGNYVDNFQCCILSVSILVNEKAYAP